jgi:hypothetical protein
MERSRIKTSQKSSPKRRGDAGNLIRTVSLTRVRSAISNGRFLLHDIDHRSAWMRRLRDLVNDHVTDLGGPDSLSSSELVLVRRSAMLTLQAEMLEQQWAGNGGQARLDELEAYGRATNSLRRLFESLGLERRAKDVTPRDMTSAVVRAIREAVS